MSSLERVLATLKGEKTDILPYTALFSLYGAALIGADTKTYYSNAGLWFKGQEKVVELFNPDILLSPFSFPIEAASLGSKIVYIKNDVPNIKAPIINKAEAIDRLKTPDYKSNKSIKFLTNSLEFLAKKYGKTKAIASPIQAPTDMPALLMGIENWIETLLFKPDFIDEIINKTTQHFVKLGNLYLEKGANFLAVTVNFTCATIITEKIFKILYPYLVKAFSKIKGPIVLHNGGCSLMPFLKEHNKLPNVVAFVLEPSPKPDIFDNARKIIEKNKLLMGNLSGSKLDKYSIQTVKRKTMEILENRKNDKHFIFATSNADIPYNTPIETIKEMVNCIRNYKN